MRKERLKIFLGFLLFVFTNIVTPFSYGPVGIDETAYLAQAEFIAGTNWNDVMIGITYHSFGCAVIPGLIIKAFGSTVFAYKLILLHNSIIIVICYFLVNKLIDRQIPNLDDKSVPIISFIVILYPSNLGYSNCLSAELYVTFGYLLISYILFEYLSCKKKIQLVLLGSISVYEVAVHQRTIGVFMAVAIILLVYLVNQKKIKHLLVFCMTICFSLLILYVYKKYSQGIIWSNSRLANENDFSSVVNHSMFERLSKKEFWTGIFCLSVGRIWYLVSASFGLILIGFSKVIKSVIKKDKDESIRVLSLFWIISFILCWGIALFNSYIPAQIYHVILGRYMDALVAPFLIVGIISFVNSKDNKRVWCYTIIVLSLSGIFISRYADKISQIKDYYHKTYNLGIYLVNSDGYTKGLFLRITLSVILAIVLSALISLALKRQKLFILFVTCFFIMNSITYDWNVMSEQKKNKTEIVDFHSKLKNIVGEIGYFPDGAHYECRLKYLKPGLEFVQLNKDVCIDGQVEYIMVPHNMKLKNETMNINSYSIYAINDFFTIYKYRD